ncbi:MAG TPA: hypothetical protein VGL59_23945 [Polyangia bacterium]|jgi:hypothetical protein
MSRTLIRIALVCVYCLAAVACSSGPGQKADGGPVVDAPPSRGNDLISSEIGDAHDAAEAGDSAADGDAARDGDAADSVDIAPDLAVDIVDVPVDLPVEKPPTDLMNGQVCQANSWCRSKFCVDGVCCNTACEGDDPMRCNGCSMAKTGQKDGTCAADKTRERMTCGQACGQVVMDVPAVLDMICISGVCQVPQVPVIVEACRNQFDLCVTSFCNQPTNRTARCVNTLCPTMGTCCCETGGNATGRSCVSTNACKNDKACVTQ